MQPRWSVRTGDPVPPGRAETGDAAEVTLQIPESDRSDQTGHVRAQVAYRLGVALARVEHDYQEDRRTGQRRDHRLRLRSRTARVCGHPSILYQPPAAPRVSAQIWLSGLLARVLAGRPPHGVPTWRATNVIMEIWPDHISMITKSGRWLVGLLLLVGFLGL
jgi:hypothetical protein